MNDSDVPPTPSFAARYADQEHRVRVALAFVEEYERRLVKCDAADCESLRIGYNAAYDAFHKEYTALFQIGSQDTRLDSVVIDSG